MVSVSSGSDRCRQGPLLCGRGGLRPDSEAGDGGAGCGGAMTEGFRGSFEIRWSSSYQQKRRRIRGLCMANPHLVPCLDTFVTDTERSA